MSSGTKILLAVVTLFVGTLVIYYGVVMPSDEASPPAEDALVEADPRDTDRTAEPPAGPVDIDDVIATRGPEREPEPRSVLATSTPRTPAPTSPPAAGETSAGPALTNPARMAVGSSTPVATPVATPGTTRGTTPGTTRGGTGIPEDQVDPASTRERTTRGVPVAPKYTPYTVADGDTMTSIAEWWFGDHRKWDLIAKANLVDPNRLRIGQVLRLPPKDSERPPLDRGAGTDRVVHTVGPGETLSSIAVDHYGNIAAWERIYRENRAVIGANPDALTVGMKLTIPAVVERTSSATRSATPGR